MINNTHIRSGERYQGLIVSIVVFLVLIAALLAFTFYTSNLLERNTVLMSHTSKTANSAQSIIKELFDLQNSYGEPISSPHLQTSLTNLREHTAEISRSLDLIEKGGQIEVNGRAVDVPAINSEIAQMSLRIAKEQWKLLEPRVTLYLADADNLEVESADALLAATSQARASSFRIEEALKILVQETSEQVASQANVIRQAQIAGIAIILAYFIIFVFFIIRRLRESDEQTEAARKETQEILQTVSTGLFLLDKDLVIGSQHSAALTRIVGTDQLAGQTLGSVLKDRISNTDLKTTDEFVKQLYNPRVKEKLVNSLNPLSKVLLRSDDGAERYLDFKFSRVYENGDIVRILVDASDVSETVYLEQRLEKERSQNDMQIEMLTMILNASPQMVNEFIHNAHTRINKMNDVLKNPGNSQFELEGKLKAIYRDMHSLKGESSALKLHGFTKIASEAEDKLHAMQNKGQLSGDDFLPLTVHFDEFLKLLHTISELNKRINSSVALEPAHPNKPSPTSNKVAVDHKTTGGTADDTVELAPEIIEEVIEEIPDAKETLGNYLVKFGHDIATRQHKKIHVNVDGMVGVIIPDNLYGITKELSVQLLRNAIVHGIADGASRIANGKPEAGQIHISVAKSVTEYAGKNKDSFVLMMEDDGLGIDYAKIRQKLLESGKYPQDRVLALNNTQLLNALFSSGFSTRDTTDEDGGRGVGLDIVKDRVKEYGGKIHVQTEAGKFTRFVIKLPIHNQ